MALQRSLKNNTSTLMWTRFINLAMLAILLAGLATIKPTGGAQAASLLNANFDSTTDGFTYQDDTFSTSQPAYASGARTTSGGYGSTGGLQVSLGGVDATTISGISGGWSYTLSLGAATTGVKLSFRYKLDQSVDYNFDEFSRVLVKLDGTQYGRGSKNYVDHIGGDGSSSQANSNTYLPTTDWQQVEIYLGNLAAGSHTLILGGYNNKKNLTTQITTVTLDDVSLTDGNSAPAVTPAQTLAGRVSSSQFLTYMQGVAAFHDRCRGSGMSCSSTDYTTNYMNSVAWIEGQLQAMGYTTVRHTFTSNTGGTNLYATKMGTVTPTQMYMVTAMLDGRGGGDAFDDDASGVALLMEAARVLAGSDVTTDKSVRFIFFDKEETGLNGSAAYASNTTSTGGRRALQGTLDEPTWLGLIQHDMILYDHGAGTNTTAQSAYADLDVEWRAGTAQETASKALALKWSFASGQYAPNYPATAYNYSTNTDDTSFQPYTAAISVRENRRGVTSGANAEWINPYYHQTTDVEASYMRDDNSNGIRDDIELGYNAVRTTLGLVAELAGAHIGGANTPPVANAQSTSTNEDTAKAITLSGSDADGNPLTYAVVTQPAHGTLSGTAPSLTYTPAANYNGADNFTFKVNDGQVDSAAATVSITVNPVNDAPVANAQSTTTNEDTAKAITLTGSDADGNPLTYAVLTQPGHGTLSGTAPAYLYAGFELQRRGQLHIQSERWACRFSCSDSEHYRHRGQ
jgi:VCBS repeat-containing protein